MPIRFRRWWSGRLKALISMFCSWLWFYRRFGRCSRGGFRFDGGLLENFGPRDIEVRRFRGLGRRNLRLGFRCFGWRFFCRTLLERNVAFAAVAAALATDAAMIRARVLGAVDANL